MTTRSGREYSIFVQTMSGTEQHSVNSEEKHEEPSLT